MFDENLMKIGAAIVAYNRENNAAKALDEFYSEDAVSVEAVDMPDSPGRETKGLQAIRGKHEWWHSAFEEHSSSAEGPFMHGEDRFGVIYEIDVTNRETKERSQMRELALYTVNNGKIVREEFYYGSGA